MFMTWTKDPGDLESALEEADVVFHLAGVNRPKNPNEFETGNAGSIDDVCTKLSIPKMWRLIAGVFGVSLVLFQNMIWLKGGGRRFGKWVRRFRR